jgi:hypothetical protein
MCRDFDRIPKIEGGEPSTSRRNNNARIYDMALKQNKKNPILCFGNLVQVLGEARPTRSEIETSTEQILQPRIDRSLRRRRAFANRILIWDYLFSSQGLASWEGIRAGKGRSIVVDSARKQTERDLDT